jgi:predicted phage baseplate assembly protein
VAYKVGGGPGGNLPAGQLDEALDNPHNTFLVPGWAVLRPSLRIAQPFPALGGKPAETLDEGRGRALDDLARQQRAITLEDYTTHAIETPGVPVARARALPNYHPSLPCFPAPGNITVVVVPECPAPQPVTGEDFLRAVERYLDRRRSLTAELHVVGPCYQLVKVFARLHTANIGVARALKRQAEQALEQFFHPLTGGPDGTGWPVGRDVYRSEILALLNSLPGVAYVDHLGLQGEGDAEPRCGNLPICPDCLVASGDHHIQVIESSRGPAPRSKSDDPCAGH